MDGNVLAARIVALGTKYAGRINDGDIDMLFCACAAEAARIGALHAPLFPIATPARAPGASLPNATKRELRAGVASPPLHFIYEDEGSGP